jgi:hypothetical protein
MEKGGTEKGGRSLNLTIYRFALGFDEIGFSIYDLTLILFFDPADPRLCLIS